MLTYRIGWPGWKALARLGAPLHLRAVINYDPEVHSFWATSPDLHGLVVEASSIAELRREVAGGAEMLLECELGEAPARAPFVDWKLSDVALGDGTTQAEERPTPAASRELRMLALELRGVLLDVDHSGKFDDVCRRTVERVAGELARLANRGPGRMTVRVRNGKRWGD